MPQKVIADAGLLVGLLSAADEHHEWAVDQFKIFSLFHTCDAVISEACARVSYAGFEQSEVLSLVENGAVKSDFNLQPNINRVLRLMEKYSDLPMDFADACVVVMCEEQRNCLVVTTDKKDFRTYRRFGRDTIPVIVPEKS